MRLYEGLFLVPGSEAQKNLDTTEEHIREILVKCSAEPLTVEQVPDQKLAYEIKGRSRGSYYLIYFNAEPDIIDHIRRECQISEVVTRNLIIRYENEKPPDEQVFKKYAAAAAGRAKMEYGGGRSHDTRKPEHREQKAPEEKPGETADENADSDSANGGTADVEVAIEAEEASPMGPSGTLPAAGE